MERVDGWIEGGREGGRPKPERAMEYAMEYYQAREVGIFFDEVLDRYNPCIRKADLEVQ